MHTCTDVLLGDELMQVGFEVVPLPGSLGEGDLEVLLPPSVMSLLSRSSFV